MAPRKQRSIRRRKRQYYPPKAKRNDPQGKDKETEKDIEASSPIVSASHRKLMAVFPAEEVDKSEISTDSESDESTSSSEDEEPSGVVFQDLGLLGNAVKNLSCKNCGGDIKLEEDRKAKKGLSRMMLIVCTTCEFVCKLPGSKECVTGKTTFAEVNRRSVMAIQSLGHGRAGLARFCGYMNMAAPMHKKAYQSHLAAIRDATVNRAKQDMDAALDYPKNEQTGRNNLNESSKKKLVYKFLDNS